MNEKTVVLVTGASSGIGRACAAELSRLGKTVFGTCRNPSRFGSAVPGVAMLAMDVGSESGTTSVVEQIIECEGHIDALVCCVGMGVAGAVEDCMMAEICLQMDTNFLGTVRTVKAVLPFMRTARKGKIVIIGSIAGVVGMPYQAFYSSSKYALEGFVESLRYEVRAFGIQVCIVEPGDFRTGFTDARREVASAGSGFYAASFARTMAVQIHDERTGHDPSEAARRVSRLLAADKLPVRATVGPLFERCAVWVKRILPASIFEKFYRVYYKLP